MRQSVKERWNRTFVSFVKVSKLLQIVSVIQTFRLRLGEKSLGLFWLNFEAISKSKIKPTSRVKSLTQIIVGHKNRTKVELASLCI
jgi:hypothetical protein